MNFSELNLQNKDDIKIININGVDIEVKQYLPVKEKNTILILALENAQSDGILNPFALDVYFHLFLILKYTNIEFSDDTDLLEAYNLLESNGVINAIITKIKREDYEDLKENLLELKEIYNNYNVSVNAFVDRIGKGLEELSSYLKNLKSEDIKAFTETIKEQLSVIQDGQN